MLQFVEVPKSYKGKFISKYTFNKLLGLSPIKYYGYKINEKVILNV